jgi:uncharacterized protein (UPF0332 family)
MTEHSAHVAVARRWLQMAEDSLAAARDDLSHGRLRPCISRLYFAAFQAVCAGLAAKGHEYGKHTAVRAAFHREYVKTGVIPSELGEIYSRLFDGRQNADYGPLAEFEREEFDGLTTGVAQILEGFRELVERSA